MSQRNSLLYIQLHQYVTCVTNVTARYFTFAKGPFFIRQKMGVTSVTSVTKRFNSLQHNDLFGTGRGTANPIAITHLNNNLLHSNELAHSYNRLYDRHPW